MNQLKSISKSGDEALEKCWNEVLHLQIAATRYNLSQDGKRGRV
jgi:hypothetical protein